MLSSLVMRNGERRISDAVEESRASDSLLAMAKHYWSSYTAPSTPFDFYFFPHFRSIFLQPMNGLDDGW